jgi:hypothetical protein
LPTPACSLDVGEEVPGCRAGVKKRLSLTWTRGILARLQAKCCVLERQQQHISGALYTMTRLGKDRYHFLSATFGQVIREEPPVTENHSKGDGMLAGCTHVIAFM